MERYYEGLKSGRGWVAHIYHYDESGNVVITDYKSNHGVATYPTKEAAEDAACEYAEEQEWDVTLG